MLVLIVEPESATAQAIDLMLKSEGFKTYVISDFEEAVDLGKLYDYDAIATEYDCEMIRRLRAAKVSTPVIVVTALSGIDDKLRAFQAGADDYLTKPFHKNELVARLHALVRRSKGQASNMLEIGDLVVDISSRRATARGHAIPLTGKEYAMLELLALRKGTTQTKEQIMNYLYGGRDEPELKIIDVFVCKLRKKLRAANVDYLETVWGRGYVLVPPKQVESPSLAPEMRDMKPLARVKSPSIVPGRV